MKQIDIFCTSDIHGFAEGVEGKQGVLQTLTELKREYPHGIFIDNGDYFSGSRLASYCNSQEGSRPLIDLANQVGFDIMVPGNHDFDMGAGRLKELSLEVSASYICANLLDQDGNYLFKPWCSVSRGDIQVGIIGLITGNLYQLTEAVNLKDIHIVRPVLSLKNIISQIRDKVDILIVSYHGGVERDMKSGEWTQYDTGEDEAYRIIEEFPEIDGIICGHQHREQAGCRNNTLYVQPGFGGKSIGRLSFIKPEDKPLQKKAQLIQAPQKKTADSIPEPFTYQWRSGYKVWCSKQMEFRLFHDFIKNNFLCDGYLIEIENSTRDGFYNSFTAPYHVSMYQFSGAEWEEIYRTYKETVQSVGALIEEKGLPDKKWYRILSNIQELPYDRIVHRFIRHIPDAYEMELVAAETRRY